MASPMNAFQREFSPFPSLFRTSGGEDAGRAAFTVLENFAREETVALLEARPHWEFEDGGEPVAAVFDVVGASREDPHAVNPATSVSRVVALHGETRRFVMGIPHGHKLVVYPADPTRTAAVVGAAQDSILRVSVVDYWA